MGFFEYVAIILVHSAVALDSCLSMQLGTEASKATTMLCSSSATVAHRAGHAFIICSETVKFIPCLSMFKKHDFLKSMTD